MSENDQKTILAVGAHPDDIEFGCGAILLKEAARGAKINLLVCSKGESGSNGTPDIRVGEATKAADMLGATIDFLDLGGDAQMNVSTEYSQLLARKIRETRPDIVLAPTTVANQHPDHAVVGQLVQNATRLARYAGLEELKDLQAHVVGNLLFYAITPSGESEESPILIDVSEYADSWKSLMECHASQMKTRDYCELQLTRARLLGLQMKCELVQALYSEDGVVVENLSSISRSTRYF